MYGIKDGKPSIDNTTSRWRSKSTSDEKLVEPERSASQEAAREEAEINALFEIPSDVPPEYTTQDAAQILTRPVALPRTAGRFDSPIVRAYPPDLAKLGISMEKWMDFVDGLSIAMIASPPLQILDKVGAIVGFVPFWPAMVAGIGTQVIAQTSQRILSKTMTDRYLARANEGYFAPRGLKVRLMKGAALKIFSGLEDAKAKPSIGAKIGSGAETFFTRVRLPIVTPIAARVLDAVKPLPPSQQALGCNGQPLTWTDRRLLSMQNTIAPLNFDVPATKVPESLMDRISQAFAKKDVKSAQKKQTRTDLNRSMLAVANGQTSAVEWSREQQGAFGNDRRAMKDERKAIRRAHKHERKAMRGRTSGKLERRVNMDQRRETKLDDQLIWLVVYPIEQDAKFQEMDAAGPLVVSNEEYEHGLEEGEAELEWEESEEEKEERRYTGH